MLSLAISFIAAYLIGSIPFGLLVARNVKNIDLREHGSKNIGATNVFRVVGKKWGLLVLFLDAFKGFIACSLVVYLSAVPIYAPLLLGVTAILGHTFPVWLKFKGGKGVATSLGVFLAIVPLAASLTFGVWALIFALSRIVSLASILAACAFPLLILLFESNSPIFWPILAISGLLMIFIVYTHRANIARIRSGEEKKLL